MVKTKKIKRRLGSFPFLSVVFSSTLSVFVAGLFGALGIFYFNQTQIFKNNINVQVYLHKNVSDSLIQELKTSLSRQHYVRKENGLPRIDFLTKEEAAKKFIEETGEDFVAFLGENPLRDALIVYIEPDFTDSGNLKTIKSHIESFKTVFEVNYFGNLIENINKNAKKIGLILFLLFILLIIATVLLINNSIRLALYSQRFLIRSMQLVGATNFFIIKPFLWRALWLGFFSGIIAVGMLWLMMYYLDQYLIENELGSFVFDQPTYLLYLSAFMLAVGSFMGLISTYKSVKKYLNMSLDELY
ncbi:MAG: permease-like cell division protein FtsX [Cytophagales bacterium]